MVIESNNKTDSNTIKFLCSYGGKILPRPVDGKLRYVGGVTRLLAVDRSISYTELMVKLSEFRGSSVTLRCQLPNGDLDTLISITSDEDLANVIEEYEKASSSFQHPIKIRAILSPPKSLKIVSPPLSAKTSHSYDFSSQKPRYAVGNGNRYVYVNRTYPPAYSVPVANRKDDVAAYYSQYQQIPYLARQIPRPVYRISSANRLSR